MPVTAPLPASLLCDVTIQIEEPRLHLGRTPWRTRSVHYIAGGTLEGERLRGEVLPGGADWADAGRGPDGSAVVNLDVRSIWRTHDGAMIDVSYGGRLVIPAAVRGVIESRTDIESLAEDAYSFRIQPLFQTGDARYGWLNAVTAVGYGRMRADGVSYRIFQLH